MFDSHIHLCSYYDTEKEFLNLEYSGIEEMMIPSIDIDSSLKALSFAQRHREARAAIGIHPKTISRKFGTGHIKRLSYKTKMSSLQKEIENLLMMKKEIGTIEDMFTSNSDLCNAIGEIGFDFTTGRKSDFEIQEIAFKLQLEIAFRHKIPLILHIRSGGGEDAYVKAAGIISAYKQCDFKGVIHAYTGTIEYAREFLNLGEKAYIGIGNALLNNNEKSGLKDTVKSIPLSRLLIETDAPYSMGKNQNIIDNPSSRIRLIAEMIADIKGAYLEEVDNQTTENARTLFDRQA